MLVSNLKNSFDDDIAKKLREVIKLKKQINYLYNNLIGRNFIDENERISYIRFSNVDYHEKVLQKVYWRATGKYYFPVIELTNNNLSYEELLSTLIIKENKLILNGIRIITESKDAYIKSIISEMVKRDIRELENYCEMIKKYNNTFFN